MTTRTRNVAASSGDEADRRTSATALVPAATTTTAAAAERETSHLLATERMSRECAATAATRIRPQSTVPVAGAHAAVPRATSNLADRSSLNRRQPTYRRIKSVTKVANTDAIPEKASLSTVSAASHVSYELDSDGLSQRLRLVAPSDESTRNSRQQLGISAPVMCIDHECNDAERLGEPLSESGKKCRLPLIFDDSLVVSPSPSEQFGVSRPAVRGNSKPFDAPAANLLSASTLRPATTPVCETSVRHQLQHCSTPHLVGRSGGHSRSVRLHEQQRLRRLVRLDSFCGASAERVRIEASGGSGRRIQLEASSGLAPRMQLESPSKSSDSIRPKRRSEAFRETTQQLLLEASSSSTKKTALPDSSCRGPAKARRDAANCTVAQVPSPSSCSTRVALFATDGDSKRAKSDAKIRQPDDVPRRRRRISITSASAATAQAEAASGRHAEKAGQRESVGSAGNVRLAKVAAGSSGIEESQRCAVSSRSYVAGASRGTTKKKHWESMTAEKPILSSSGSDSSVPTGDADCPAKPHVSKGSSRRETPVAAVHGKSSVTRATDDCRDAMVLTRVPDVTLRILSRPAVLSKATGVSSDRGRLKESIGAKRAAAVDVVGSARAPATMSTLGGARKNASTVSDGAPVYRCLLRMQPGDATSGRLLPSQMVEKWRQEKQSQQESGHSSKLQAFDYQPQPIGSRRSGREDISTHGTTDNRDSASQRSSAVVAVSDVNRVDDRAEAAFHRKPLSSPAVAAGRSSGSRQSFHDGISRSPPTPQDGRKVIACQEKDTTSSAGTAAVVASGGNGGDGQSKVVPKKNVRIDRRSREASTEQSKPRKPSSARHSSRVDLPNRVSDLKDLTNDQLRLLIQKYHGHLTNIRDGKVKCWRHTKFEGASLRALRSLDFATPANIVTGDQLELIAETLSQDETLCDSKLESVDYVLRVLVPEVLTLIYMDVHDVSRRDAEAFLQTQWL